MEIIVANSQVNSVHLRRVMCCILPCMEKIVQMDHEVHKYLVRLEVM